MSYRIAGVVVMESTAQYWRPVWEALEQHWRPRRRVREGAPRLSGTLHLAQAQSNRGPGGRKKDFPDAERFVKRLVAQELTLSFVPDAEQRLLANGDAAQVSDHPEPRATPQPAGGPAGGSAHQGVQSRVRPAARRPSRRGPAPGRGPDSASVPRSRSLRRSAPRRPRFLHRSISPPGWEPAPATRRAPASTTAIAARRAIARCVASSTKPPMPP